MVTGPKIETKKKTSNKRRKRDKHCRKDVFNLVVHIFRSENENENRNVGGRA